VISVLLRLGILRLSDRAVRPHWPDAAERETPEASDADEASVTAPASTNAIA